MAPRYTATPFRFVRQWQELTILDRAGYVGSCLHCPHRPCCHHHPYHHHYVLVHDHKPQIPEEIKALGGETTRKEEAMEAGWEVQAGGEGMEEGESRVEAKKLFLRLFLDTKSCAVSSKFKSSVRWWCVCRRTRWFKHFCFIVECT